MSLPQIPPGGGDRRRHTHWHYVGTECGKTWNAWSAGRTHWYVCHTKGKSKPCSEVMTGGKVKCVLCNPLNPPEVIGYVPLYREMDARPCMVIVHEYIREQLDQIALHRMVMVMRGTQVSDGTAVVLHPKSSAKYTSTLRERMVPADMTETLLRMWKLPLLTEWYRKTQPPSDNPVSLPEGTARREDGQPYSPMMQGAAKRWGGPDVVEPSALGDVLDVEREKLQQLVRKQPSKNGKHPPAE
jgi:hypothetical protein